MEIGKAGVIVIYNENFLKNFEVTSEVLGDWARGRALVLKNKCLTEDIGAEGDFILGNVYLKSGNYGRERIEFLEKLEDHLRGGSVF